MDGWEDTPSNEKLSKGMRLILANQYRILEHLEPEAKKHWKLEREVMEAGYEHEYDRYPTISDPLPESECKLVVNILDMCWYLQKRLAELEDLPELTYLYEVEKVGFDGNHETKHMLYAEFVVESRELFRDIITLGGFNSHSPRLSLYKELLGKYKTELQNRPRFDPLSLEAITRILE